MGVPLSVTGSNVAANATMRERIEFRQTAPEFVPNRDLVLDFWYVLGTCNGLRNPFITLPGPTRAHTTPESHSLC